MCVPKPLPLAPPALLARTSSQKRMAREKKRAEVMRFMEKVQSQKRKVMMPHSASIIWSPSSTGVNTLAVTRMPHSDSDIQNAP